MVTVVAVVDVVVGGGVAVIIAVVVVVARCAGLGAAPPEVNHGGTLAPLPVRSAHTHAHTGAGAAGQRGPDPGGSGAVDRNQGTCSQ